VYRHPCLPWIFTENNVLQLIRTPVALHSKVYPFSTWRSHVAWMYILWVCTRAARKENPNPNPNSHDHCLLSKWKCRTYVHTHLCNQTNAM